MVIVFEIGIPALSRCYKSPITAYASLSIFAFGKFASSASFGVHEVKRSPPPVPGSGSVSDFSHAFINDARVTSCGSSIVHLFLKYSQLISTAISLET